MSKSILKLIGWIILMANLIGAIISAAIIFVAFNVGGYLGATSLYFIIITIILMSNFIFSIAMISKRRG